jgi:hypothetical protein
MKWYQNFGPPNFQFWERLSVRGPFLIPNPVELDVIRCSITSDWQKDERAGTPPGATPHGATRPRLGLALANISSATAPKLRSDAATAVSAQPWRLAPKLRSDAATAAAARHWRISPKPRSNAATAVAAHTRYLAPLTTKRRSNRCSRSTLAHRAHTSKRISNR